MIKQEEYFKCDKSQIAYGRYYKKGNKKIGNLS